MNDEQQMIMRKGHKILATAFALALAAGCVKDTLHDTPHPDKGVVAVEVDYPQGAGDGYTVEVDGNPLPDGGTVSVVSRFASEQDAPSAFFNLSFKVCRFIHTRIKLWWITFRDIFICQVKRLQYNI